MTPDTIYTVIVSPKGKDLMRSSRSSYESFDDHLLAYKAVEFKYAARRQKKELVVAIVPRFVASVLRVLGYIPKEKTK